MVVEGGDLEDCKLAKGYCAAGTVVGVEFWIFRGGGLWSYVGRVALWDLGFAVAGFRLWVCIVWDLLSWYLYSWVLAAERGGLV